MNEVEINGIVAELDQEYTGKLPEQAIREAQRHPAEITPFLIELIRKATDAVRRGQIPKGEGHLYALFLLAEFRVKEALPAILDSVSLPGDGPFDLYGDSITEDLSRILAVLVDGDCGKLDELINNRAVNEYVRWKAAETYRYFVRDGRLTRDEAVHSLHEDLRVAIASRDKKGASGIVAELYTYAPHEALEDIKEAFRRQLIDRGIVNLPSIETSIAKGEPWVQEELSHCPTSGIEDTFLEMSQWSAYQEPVHTAPILDSESHWDADSEVINDYDPLAESSNGHHRVGRNEPCPCGSGKKFKKCCGAK
ncbi:MAG: DUF1186 domain-containing protein [Pirellulales bacterium]